MKKHVLIASMVVGLGLAPVAALAADSSGSNDGSSPQMKGPPNANGAQQGRSEFGAETNANAPTASGDNGAASAKATGESGDKSKY